ncbi:MAG TPA: HD domain-containing phosphohydrolase [Terriglobales bacterium]|jgi:putative nucleotidyltransferase with HDIG domain|nr:HD domain-containing phosphohydrolase [Terriglobales bacterium]
MRLPNRIPLLYLISGVLILVGVVPLYFYGTQVVGINRERLKINEQLLQNTVTKSLSDDVDHRQATLQTSLGNLSAAVLIASGGNLASDHVNTPELRALVERFTSSSDILDYATLLNEEGKGVSAGRIVPDTFVLRELEHAFAAAREGRVYNGQALTVGSGKAQRTTMLVSTPVMSNGHFLGMIGAVVDLQYLINSLQTASHGGLETFVVDRQGRLVAGADTQYATGQEMTGNQLVKSFVDQGTHARLVATSEFEIKRGKKTVDMLGTFSPVPSLQWAVIAEKTQADAYQSVFEMQRQAQLFALLAILLSVAFGIFAARQLATPLQTLTESSRAIARGDFSQRVQVKSRTEIGELADTFNSMTSDLERFVLDLKQAAEENRTLFLSSIQMLAGAVDEKDPYTRGHSDRVTRYSVLIAKELGLPEEEVEKIRISAQLHDVGKIGIEDRILKKPGALTPDEYEIMKTHTTKGAAILRPVEMLKEMIPGIELHHESLDGRGYPHGLKGDEIPLSPRIIMVADCFDAMTTNRPYQAAMDPEYVVRIINSLVNTKFDPRIVAALSAIFARGDFRIRRAAAITPQAHAAAATAAETV